MNSEFPHCPPNFFEECVRRIYYCQAARHALDASHLGVSQTEGPPTWIVSLSFPFTTLQKKDTKDTSYFETHPFIRPSFCTDCSYNDILVALHIYVCGAHAIAQRRRESHMVYFAHSRRTMDYPPITQPDACHICTCNQPAHNATERIKCNSGFSRQCNA